MFGINNPEPLLPVDSSIISEDMRITGPISASKPVILYGQLNGNVDAVSIHVKSTGIVSGDIKAQSVVIDGTMTGTIIADELHLMPSAKFRGNIRCKGVKVEDGANIKAEFLKELSANG